jgi:hypothetical protein
LGGGGKILILFVVDQRRRVSLLIFLICLNFITIFSLIDFKYNDHKYTWARGVKLLR